MVATSKTECQPIPEDKIQGESTPEHFKTDFRWEAWTPARPECNWKTERNRVGHKKRSDHIGR